MNRYLSMRLAAHANSRQVEASMLADSAARVVDRAAASVWGSLLRSIRSRPLNPYGVTQDHFRHLVPVMAKAIDTSLKRIALWGRRQTLLSLRSTMPLRYLRAGAVRSVGESLLENVPDQWRPGTIELTPSGGEYLWPDDIEMSEEEERDQFLAMLFPPPSIEETESIVYSPVQGRTWIERLEGATRTSASPQQIASTVAIGFAGGKTAQEIARDLLPVVDGVRSTARRIARTESLRVSHEVQMRAWDGLGDLCIGFQIHATLDQNTRPEHAARNGIIYYKHPTGNQRSVDEMPRPPLEADGRIAWNCRCHTSPILAPDRSIADDAGRMAVFTDAEEQLVPDPLTYSEWFDRAPLAARQTAVGVRRYKVVSDALGASPSWEYFIDPDQGGIMPMASLRDETDDDRAARVGRVRQQMGERREWLRKAKMLGWV